ncbi:MAG: ice-binding family protein, partial [Saprospiraceae bacterium]
NSLFVIRIVGAFTTGALTTVVLTNGAQSRNIYWVGQAAMAMAAGTIMKGTLVSSAGAISMAASSNLEGRMFTKTGAISMGPGTLTLPPGVSYVNWGVLSTFVIFTSVGAIANTPPSFITGDVGTNDGAIAGFEGINGNVYGPGAAPNPVNNTLVTFTMYQNGVLIASSSRTMDINTSVISLQTMATVTTGQPIAIWWRVDTGVVTLGNRILSLVKAN